MKETIKVLILIWVAIAITAVAINLFIIGKNLASIDRAIRYIDASGVESAVKSLERTLDIRLK